MVLRKIFGPKMDDLTGEWRKPHNEKLNDLYSSPNIIRVIKSRRMRWAGHVATIILPVVLYGCETWSLTLREKCRLKVFENRVLSRKFGSKRDSVKGE
jgi:hypothetical protein